MNKTLLCVTIGAALLLTGAAAANAGSLNGNFQSSATVNAQCQTLTTNALAFGTYDPTANTNTTANAAISVNCTKGTTVTVSLNAGSTTGATTAQRLLANGSNTLNYNLYTDSTYGTVLDATHSLSGTGTGLSSAVNFTVYGAIAKNQLDVTPGSFTDTITVTVSY